MTVTGRLWNGRTVAPFVKVEELPLEFKPTGTKLNTGELTIVDLLREIKALEMSIEFKDKLLLEKDNLISEQLRRLKYLEDQDVH